MEVSEKAWRAFQAARSMLRKCSMDEMSAALRKYVTPEESQEAMKETLAPQQIANLFYWEATLTMEGLLEMAIAIQTMKNDGTITVKMADGDYSRKPLGNSGIEHPDDHAGIHHPDDTADGHPDSAGT